MKAPTFTVDSVLALARADNPALQAARTRDESAKLGVRAAHGTYLPTLQVSTGLGGYTNTFTNPELPHRTVGGGHFELPGAGFDSRGRGALRARPAQCGTLMPDGTLPPA